MFRSFFLDKKWFAWSILGTGLIVFITWFQVQISVMINEWYGEFYDMLQEALANPGKFTFEAFLAKCMTFLQVAAVSIVVAVFTQFFVRHYVFRWRTAMNDFYTKHWEKLRQIEGASQRVQEDTMRFASTVESLAVAVLESVMVLIAFLPILWVLSSNVTELPWIGPVDHSLVYIALLTSIVGTGLVAMAGIKLPWLEFNNQKVEAAYRKELVYGEDYAERAQPPALRELFSSVRSNYFTLYRHYLYFDVTKWSFLQVNVLVPLIALGPTIVSGAITLGMFQQISNAFNKVDTSFNYLIRSWSTIVELMSIYKRLKAFEAKIGHDDDASIAPTPPPAAPPSTPSAVG